MPGTLYLYDINKDAPDRDICLLTEFNDKLRVKEWKHIPVLAPSEELQQQVIDWRNKKEWNKKNWSFFKGAFEHQLNRPETQKMLQLILRRLYEGKDVALGAYGNDDKCHNEVLAEWIQKQEKGISVVHGNEVRKKKAEQLDTNQQLKLF